MASEDKVQRVKIVGPLYFFKTWLGIIRDLLLITFLVVGIFGIFAAVLAFQEISKSPILGALKSGDIGSLIGENVGAAMAGGGLNQIQDQLKVIEQSYKQDPSKALAEVQNLEILARSAGVSSQDLAPLSALKKAIKDRNDAQFYQLMEEIKSSLQ